MNLLLILSRSKTRISNSTRFGFTWVVNSIDGLICHELILLEEWTGIPTQRYFSACEVCAACGTPSEECHTANYTNCVTGSPPMILETNSKNRIKLEQEA